MLQAGVYDTCTKLKCIARSSHFMLPQSTQCAPVRAEVVSCLLCTQFWRDMLQNTPRQLGLDCWYSSNRPCKDCNQDFQHQHISQPNSQKPAARHLKAVTAAFRNSALCQPVLCTGAVVGAPEHFKCRQTFMQFINLMHKLISREPCSLPSVAVDFLKSFICSRFHLPQGSPRALPDSSFFASRSRIVG